MTRILVIDNYDSFVYTLNGYLLQLGATTGSLPPIRVSQTVLFRAKYEVGVSTMYDASPDGQRFVIVQQP